jgi:hypothetical protein
MARQKGIIKIEGSLGDLSFYSSVFGDIVRRKGGASKEKIRKSPAFKNLRKHHAEFRDCAAAGKLLRQGWLPYTRQAADHTLVWRVTQVMNRVKDMDTVASWGSRSVTRGLESAEGRNLLKGFELNSKAPLKETLKTKVLTKDGAFYIHNLAPKQQIVFPKGATGVRITGIVSAVDFKTKKHDLHAQEIVVERGAKKQDLVLSPPGGTIKGFIFYLLQLRFVQEVNGTFYDLKEGNSLAIVNIEVV